MMKNTVKSLLIAMLLAMMLLSILPMTAFANSAEPPSLVIIVNNPPKDLKIVMISNNSSPEAEVKKVAWEGYYVFYRTDMQKNSKYTFKVTTKGESFECTLDVPLESYNNVATLDLERKQLTTGKYPFRKALLVLIRVALTLLIEGIIFLLFKFRQKRSWLVFLFINLITQGLLNIWLNQGGSLMPSYLLIGLIFGEIIVLIVEMIAFPFFIKEHNDDLVIKYAFTANFISLIAGGYIIAYLPV